MELKTLVVVVAVVDGQEPQVVILLAAPAALELLF
jgi:hypothetical protein